jgi:hypothetical protein
VRARWLLPATLAAAVVVLAVAVAVAFRAGRASAPSPAPQPITRPGLPPVPTDGAYLGLWHKVAPTDPPAVQQAGFLAAEERAGRPMAIAHFFYDFDKPFPTDNERWAIGSGHSLLISWNGRDTAGIAAGAYDDLIRSRARAVKALGVPVFLRWLWEMDGQGKADRAGTPRMYIAAWRHLRAVFATEGADAVAWVWCPNAAAFDTGRAAAWYPGDDAVDWLCADGYNFATPALPWVSFEHLYRHFVAWGVKRGKPLMVGEVGTVERRPGEKAAWLAAIPRTLQRTFPAIRAVVYFDEERDGWDWRIRSSPSAVDGFRTFAGDAWMRRSP